MRGLEEARALYEEYGRPLLHRDFPELEGRIAVGLAGHGSECYGFDDELSRDHDFARGFCLWLTDGDDLLYGVALNRWYRSLPLGESGKRSALAEDNCGVRRTAFFYRHYTGSPGAPESWRQWLSLPAHALAEATNGQVFRDDLGEFSAIREKILHGMPEDVRKKKLAARLIEMAQTGQYNYARCLKHGEAGAAALELADFVRAACGAIYLLEKRHMPYSGCSGAWTVCPGWGICAAPWNFCSPGRTIPPSARGSSRISAPPFPPSSASRASPTGTGTIWSPTPSPSRVGSRIRRSGPCT